MGIYIFQKHNLLIIYGPLVSLGDPLRGRGGETKMRPKVPRGTYTVLIQSLFRLKPYFWSKFEQNLQKRVFCLYFGRFSIVKCPILKSRVAEAEISHGMTYGVFFVSYRSNKKS